MSIADRGADLRLSVRIDGSTAIVTAEGNLDDYTASLLRDRLAACVDSGVRSFTLELRHIALIDSSGLSALVFGYKLARRNGGEFNLCGDADLVERLLHRTALDRVIPLQPPTDDLLHQPHRHRSQASGEK